MSNITGKVFLSKHEKRQRSAPMNVVICLFEQSDSHPVPEFDGVLKHHQFSRSVSVHLPNNGDSTAAFEFSNVDFSKEGTVYTLFAFETSQSEFSGKSAETCIGGAVGWYRAGPGLWLKKIDSNVAKTTLEVELRSARSSGFSPKTSKNQCGKLRQVDKIWTLLLTGSIRDRAFAHGELCVEEILDFYEYYVLEGMLFYRIPNIDFNAIHGAMCSVITKPPVYLEELQAMFDGMKSTGNSLFVPTLGRDFTLDDLHVLNAIFDARSIVPAKCSQFVAWGPATVGTDVAGGIVCGRNMDNEIDVRKVTVSHFLVVCHDRFERPKYDNKQHRNSNHVDYGKSRRFISAFWPGFLGLLTGVNEDGLYSCENAGNVSPSDVFQGIIPGQWTMREFLSWNTCEGMTPKKAADYFVNYACDGGGVNGLGGIFVNVWGTPDPNSKEITNVGSMVYESDRIGQDWRIPGEFRPIDPNVIMASNHFIKYGCPSKPKSADPSEFQFRSKPSAFPSAWRYKVAMELMEAWLRAGGKIGTERIKQLLQSTCHGITEHSMIMKFTKSSGVEVGIAVADGTVGRIWDAPHDQWIFVSFNKFFD